MGVVGYKWSPRGFGLCMFSGAFHVQVLGNRKFSYL